MQNDRSRGRGFDERNKQITPEKGDLVNIYIYIYIMVAFKHRDVVHDKTPTLLLLLLLLFLTFSVLVANPKKLLYTVANPARGLLNREKRTKEKVWQHTPPPTPHTARSEKINKITRRIYRRYAGGRSRVRTRIPSARRLGLWVWLRNSTLPSAIIRFPVSLLLSSPRDV